MRPGYTLYRLNHEDDRLRRADAWLLRDHRVLATAGYAIVGLDPRRVSPSLDRIALYGEWRGQGLGREMIRELHTFYGHLRGDDQGQSSPESIKAWLALGAVTVPGWLGDFGQSMYYLPKVAVT